MRITITRTAAMIVVLTFCAFAPARADQRHSTYVQGALPDFAYTVHGELWLRSLHGSSAWPVSTPWPVSSIAWSPDGRAIAFQGRSGIGVAVLHGHTGRTVFARRLSGCCSAELG